MTFNLGRYGVMRKPLDLLVKGRLPILAQRRKRIATPIFNRCND
jgi:hypothetical protein